jgi:hypothetical protein
MEMAAGEALYLFCFAPAPRVPELEGAGVDGRHPLFHTTWQEIAAILSAVAVEEFCGEEAEARMQDLAWLGPRVCRHQEVIIQVMHHSPVLPVPFGTLFSSRASLEKLMGECHPRIAAFLELVADKEEWAVKGLLDQAKAREKLWAQVLAAQKARLSALPPGRRYFQEQGLRVGMDQEWQRRWQKIRQQLAREMMQEAVQFCERRVLGREVTGSLRDMVLNWAFLVPHRAVANFHALVHRANRDYAQEGLVLECSGPWPPYSFTPPLRGEGNI